MMQVLVMHDIFSFKYFSQFKDRVGNFKVGCHVMCIRSCCAGCTLPLFQNSRCPSLAISNLATTKIFLKGHYETSWTYPDWSSAEIFTFGADTT